MVTSTDIRKHLQWLYDDFCSKPGHGGWRSVGLSIGISGAYARQIALGQKPVTPSIAEKWLIAYGFEPRREWVPVCPDCGKVHNGGRCNGKPVEVVLRPQRRQRAPEVQRMVDGLLKAADRAGIRDGDTVRLPEPLTRPRVSAIMKTQS